MVNYAILNIGRRLAVSLMGAMLIEWIIDGVVIGLVYKPAAVGSRQRAAV
jgi:hypothetical protein